VKSNLFDGLRTGRNDDPERLKVLMREIRAIMDAKSKRSAVGKIRGKKPKTEPGAWE
jgi:hypothetical protein